MGSVSILMSRSSIFPQLVSELSSFLAMWPSFLRFFRFRLRGSILGEKELIVVFQQAETSFHTFSFQLFYSEFLIVNLQLLVVLKELSSQWWWPSLHWFLQFFQLYFRTFPGSFGRFEHKTQHIGTPCLFPG